MSTTDTHTHRTPVRGLAVLNGTGVYPHTTQRGRPTAPRRCLQQRSHRSVSSWTHLIPSPTPHTPHHSTHECEGWTRCDYNGPRRQRCYRAPTPTYRLWPPVGNPPPESGQQPALCGVIVFARSVNVLYRSTVRVGQPQTWPQISTYPNILISILSGYAQN
jgi:hypothetical protein